MAEQLASFSLRVLTPEKQVYSADTIDFLKAPGAAGEVGILSNHSPSLIKLQSGEILIREGETETWRFVSGGLLEVTEIGATLLTPYLEDATQIDIERAKASMARAVKRLDNPSESIDVARARAAFRRAEQRVQLAEKLAEV